MEMTSLAGFCGSFAVLAVNKSSNFGPEESLMRGDFGSPPRMGSFPIKRWPTQAGMMVVSVAYATNAVLINTETAATSTSLDFKELSFILNLRMRPVIFDRKSDSVRSRCQAAGQTHRAHSDRGLSGLVGSHRASMVNLRTDARRPVN